MSCSLTFLFLQLAKFKDQRRLTVTVAHAPEVQRWGLERYFGVDLKWRMFRGDKSRDEIIDAMSEGVDESDEETEDDLLLEDEDEATLPKELPFRPSYQKRSRGTVQHAAYEWSQHKSLYSDGHYTLAIAARNSAGHAKWATSPSPLLFACVRSGVKNSDL